MLLMVELASATPGEYLPLKAVSDNQGISVKYLEQIVTPLARVGLVKSERGSQGGYRLTKKPEEYTVGMILRLTEGSLAITTCTQDEQNLCERYGCCTTVKVWEKINKAISDVVDNITIADLAADEQSSTNNFVI